MSFYMVHSLLDVLRIALVMTVDVAAMFLSIVFDRSCFVCLVLLSRVISSSGSWPVKWESNNSSTSLDYL